MSVTIRSDGYAPFKFDQAAIEALVDEWGIQRPVIVQDHFTTEHTPWTGGQQQILESGEHFIQLNPYAIVNEAQYDGISVSDEANKCLIHELQHARQFDSFTPFGLRLTYTAETHRVGYRDNRYEIDARTVAEELAPVHRLVLANDNLQFNPWRQFGLWASHESKLPECRRGVDAGDLEVGDASRALLSIWESSGYQVVEERLDEAQANKIVELENENELLRIELAEITTGIAMVRERFAEIKAEFS